MSDEVNVCQDKGLIFESLNICRKCKGLECEYLQQVKRSESNDLIKIGYLWASRNNTSQK